MAAQDKTPANYTAASLGEVFQSVVDEVREVYKHTVQAAPTLSAEDFRDLPALARKLKASTESVSAHVGRHLQDATRGSLNKWTPGSALPDALRQALLTDFNAIIQGKPLYDQGAFTDVALRPQTKAWLTQELQRDDLARLNRWLLEDAYPLELWKAPPPSGALVSAVDIELNFKSVTISEKGWVLFGKDTDQSQMEIKLATRITPPATKSV